MKTILTALLCLIEFPRHIMTAHKLRKNGWTPSKDGKWQKQITYGTDNWTLNYSVEGALEEIEKEDKATHWNPGNKVVQDHRDGKVNHDRTNKERKKRGLPVPWEPWMAAQETREADVL